MQETKREEYSDLTSHAPGTAKGEDTTAKDGKEEGRYDKEDDSGGDRPTGGSTARSSTSVNADDRDPIDPDMPNLPPA